MNKRHFCTHMAAGLGLLAATLAPAQAQPTDWPNKPVRWVVPFPPGGAMDAIARILGEKAGKALGQTFVIENRPGAGGNIGATSVAKSPADGYTIMITSIGMATNLPLYGKLAYDPVKDFAPVSLLAVVPNVLVVNAGNSKARTLQDVIAAARQAPGKLSYASAGNGTSIHLAGEVFTSMTGTDLLHVPYKGSGPAVADLLTPKDHPFGTKRPCVDTGYYATFNRPNVELVNLRAEPLVGFNAQGIQTSKKTYAFDAVVLATGFDAMTGAIDRIDLRGVGGRRIKDHWEEGPRTYLGLMVSGFPNMFTITGPGSPSVLTNMINSIEQHVEWIADCLVALKQRQQTSIEASPEAEAAWCRHSTEAVTPTMLPQANSWYMGANVPGKPRMFMPYAGGLHTYTEICKQVTEKGYEGFIIRQGDRVLSESRAFTSQPAPGEIPENLLPIIVERLMAAGLMPAAT